MANNKNETYINRFESVFKKFPISQPLVRAKALQYLSGKSTMDFIMLCENMHVSKTFEIRDEDHYYSTLAYSALEAIKRRTVA